MEKIFLLILSLNLVFATSVPEYLPGTAVPRQRAEKSGVCSAGWHFDCLDCHTLVACQNGKQLSYARCANYEKYCYAGKCRSVPDPQAHCPIPPLNCPTAKTFYPHPENCERYIYCDENREYLEYKCELGYVYDPITNLCRFKRSNGDCIQVNCVFNHARALAYLGDNSIYVFCGDKPVLMKCPENYIFVQNLQECQFVCPFEGRFAVFNKPASFYLCLKNSLGQIQPFEQSCPPNYIFNQESANCIVQKVPEIEN